MPRSPKLPPAYRQELDKLIAAAKARGTDVSLCSDKLCLKNEAGKIIAEEDPYDPDGDFPGYARGDFESFLSAGFRCHLFSDLSHEEGFGDGDYSEFRWRHNAEFDVVGNGCYREGHGFEVTLELICPCLADGKRVRLEHTRQMGAWPTPSDIELLRNDIDDLIKDWDRLLKFQAYVLDQKMEFEVRASRIAAEGFEVSVKRGQYWFRSISCEGDWDQATIDAYEDVTRRFSEWLKSKLVPDEELPEIRIELDLV